MNIWEDQRFRYVQTDPRFNRLFSHKKKFIIDKRFQAIFNNKDFQFQGGINEYGKIIEAFQNKSYYRFYKLNEKTKSYTIIKKEKRKRLNINEFLKENTDEYHDLWSDGENKESLVKKPFESEIIKNGSSFKRLALVSMDWGQIRAIDVFVIFNSFLPENGVIKDVIIYPTEIGKKHLKKEKDEGLDGLKKIILEQRFSETKIKMSNIIKESNYAFNVEEFRYFQLLKMRYFFALIICNNTLTAEILYNRIDGMEFEHSSNRLDLRFVDDKWTAKYPIHDRCNKLPKQYVVPEFFTKAIQHTNIDFTLDEDLQCRKDFFKKTLEANVNNLEKNQLKEYLASNESEKDKINFNVFFKKKNRFMFNGLLKELKNQESKFLKKDRFVIKFRSMFNLNLGEKLMEERGKEKNHKLMLRKQKRILEKYQKKKSLITKVRGGKHLYKQENNEKSQINLLLLKYKKKKNEEI